MTLDEIFLSYKRAAVLCKWQAAQQAINQARAQQISSSRQELKYTIGNAWW